MWARGCMPYLGEHGLQAHDPRSPCLRGSGDLRGVGLAIRPGAVSHPLSLSSPSHPLGRVRAPGETRRPQANVQHQGRVPAPGGGDLPPPQVMVQGGRLPRMSKRGGGERENTP